MYNAYQKGGASAAISQYGKSVYETSGAKSLIDIGGKAIKGDPRALGSLSTIVSAGIITHKASGNNSKSAVMGDLTKNEIGQIQSEINKAGRPLEVVGSAAEGTRRNVGSNLPIGKEVGTRSDIDNFKKKVFRGSEKITIRECVENINLTLLDYNHILPSNFRGVLYPVGYD